ncbi:MAG: GPR endopeptidase [Ruminococcaceae bacterium]|nr:GPR endopeptidase [Oscillospiraceae bacterium]
MDNQKRTDLALEAHELWRGRGKTGSLPGVVTREHDAFGYRATVVEITDSEGARELGKPIGAYVTLDLRPYWRHAEDALERAARAVAAEVRALLGGEGARAALVVGLGNRAMTPDAIGPQAAEHVLVTRHLRRQNSFRGFTPVSVLAPGVLGRTGLEAAELIRAAVRTVRPDVVLAIDALASRSLERVCTTVQLSDTGIVPGSGVGNRRLAIDRASLGVPVLALGVPTVVDARTLALDLLESAGVEHPLPSALCGSESGVMVTTRDIDAQLRELARIVGYGVNLALQPLDYASLCALMG